MPESLNDNREREEKTRLYKEMVDLIRHTGQQYPSECLQPDTYERQLFGPRRSDANGKEYVPWKVRYHDEPGAAGEDGQFEFFSPVGGNPENTSHEIYTFHGDHISRIVHNTEFAPGDGRTFENDSSMGSKEDLDLDEYRLLQRRITTALSELG